MKQTIPKISLYGDVKQYIQDLSKVFFDEIINSTIKNTNLLNKIDCSHLHSNRDTAVTPSSLNPFDDSKEETETESGNGNQDRFNSINSVHMSRLIVWIYKELETYEKLFERLQNRWKVSQDCVQTIQALGPVRHTRLVSVEQSLQTLHREHHQQIISAKPRMCPMRIRIKILYTKTEEGFVEGSGQ